MCLRNLVASVPHDFWGFVNYQRDVRPCTPVRDNTKCGMRDKYDVTFRRCIFKMANDLLDDVSFAYGSAVKNQIMRTALIRLEFFPDQLVDDILGRGSPED